MHQEENVDEWDQEPPTTLADIVHPPCASCEGGNQEKESGDVTDVTVTRKDQAVENRGRNRQQDGEEVPEPEILALGATTKV